MIGNVSFNFLNNTLIVTLFLINEKCSLCKYISSIYCVPVRNSSSIICLPRSSPVWRQKHFSFLPLLSQLGSSCLMHFANPLITDLAKGRRTNMKQPSCSALSSCFEDPHIQDRHGDCIFRMLIIQLRQATNSNTIMAPEPQRPTAISLYLDPF